MTINELREKRNQAWNAAKAFVETKRDKDGLLSDEDSATYAQMEKKVQDYGAEIERMEAMAAMPEIELVQSIFSIIAPLCPIASMLGVGASFALIPP